MTEKSAEPLRESSDHFVRLRILLLVAPLKHTLLSMGAMLHEHENMNGITTSSLFRRGCRGGKSDGGGTGKTAYVTSFIEPADSRPLRKRLAPNFLPAVIVLIKIIWPDCITSRLVRTTVEDRQSRRSATGVQQLPNARMRISIRST
jgi:hypothetical protein